MKIALVGYGKMGKEIEKIALLKGDQISFKIGSKNLEDLTLISPSNTDVAIEFTKPEQAFDNVKTLLKAKVPVVCGTTAWLDKLEEAKALAAANETSLFYAPNYSLGVNLFFELNRKLAKMMADYDDYEVSMEEIHHTEKLDSPSGTAVKLAEGLLECLPEKKEWINSETQDKSQVGIISKRISGVPGTHSVLYKSPIDEISISHVAYSRKGFAQGAWLAAKFLIDKTGFFEMKDML